MSTKMALRFKQVTRILTCLAAVFLLTNLSLAQEDQEANGLCFPQGNKTATVQGFIGGESHDSYVIHLKAGRKVTVRITSRGNRAGFSVSASEFGDPVNFGRETDGGHDLDWHDPSNWCLFYIRNRSSSGSLYIKSDQRVRYC